MPLILKYSFPGKAFGQNTLFSNISVQNKKSLSFVFFGYIIFDVTKSTMFTLEKFDNALK